MYRIVVSGPQGGVSAAVKALSAAGFSVLLDIGGNPAGHDHGLTHEVDPSAFLTCDGEDIDKAHSAVEPLGWRLRSHYHRPEPQRSPTILDKLALLGITPAELKAVLR